MQIPVKTAFVTALWLGGCSGYTDAEESSAADVVAAPGGINSEHEGVTYVVQRVAPLPRNDRTTADERSALMQVDSRSTKVPCDDPLQQEEIVFHSKLMQCSYVSPATTRLEPINRTCLEQQACPSGYLPGVTESWRISLEGLATQGFGREFSASGRVAIVIPVGPSAPEGNPCTAIDKSKPGFMIELNDFRKQLALACAKLK
jgi:hypothetical protein